ncbi:ABC transporter substrate-binding protein [Streptomyces xiaopingdaonensis]|uniref:ABC transporter substrate-binding protein n=1 Tax=Streptomyces xiaopingdaonensis TaxID=1565415 RepID=UPI000309FE98|nr:ABC transporter substrate-binding protein [Streptomyces xiaopingdaonensis]
MLGLAVLAGALVAVVFATRDSECGQGLQQVEGSCMGVSAGEFAYDDDLRGLVRSVAGENNKVAEEEESYRRIAVTMPFSSDTTSAMPLNLIKHGLAGAAAAQRAANAGPGGGPKYQLLLADIGKQMQGWRPVVEVLEELTRNDGPPLIATAGLGSSTSDSKKFMKALGARGIPSMGPVITSSNMNAGRYFFKNSPSNTHFVGALKQWLEDNPGDGTKYLVYADRTEDTYSVDLHDQVMRAFGDKYDLKRNSSSFIGTRGEEAGTPQLFQIPVVRICTSRTDTVFYAGRDEDLPALVKRLATSSGCGYKKPLRILKVGIGLPPELTGGELTDQMRKAGITIVNAAAVDPEWQREESKPSGFRQFHKHFAALAEKEEMGPKPLEDGYAVMYYDAVHTVAEASGLAFEDVGEEQEKTASAARIRNNVHNKLLNLNPDRRGSGDGCSPCVEGAGGTYGFNQQTSRGLWPVCKAVHILEYPAPKVARRGDGKHSGKQAEPAELYRTYGESFAGNCPRGE